MQIYKNKKHIWFLVGIVGILLAAPNSTVIKHTVEGIDPTLFNALRFGLLAVCLTPYIFFKRKAFTKQSLKYSLYVGLFMAIAVVTYVWAIRLSQASYVSILTLVTPVVFILYSMKLDSQRINRRSFAGISLAAAGAFTIVALPIVINQNAGFVFYPLATLFILGNCLSFPLAIIFSKKAHQAGVPVMATLGVSSWVIVAISMLMIPLTLNASTLPSATPSLLFGILYSGVVVALMSRILNIVSYEHIGAVVNAALSYTETLIAVILPVFILHEKLSIEMVLGGILILLGVYVVEHHKSAHHKYAHLHRHH